MVSQRVVEFLFSSLPIRACPWPAAQAFAVRGAACTASARERLARLRRMAKMLVTHHADAIERLAAALIERETIGGAEVDGIVGAES
jgi:hypothetical protein